MTSQSGSGMSLIEQALLLATDLRPYYHRAIAALTPVQSDKVPTVGVDKHWRLYWNPQWCASVTLLELATVIAAHEVEHLLRDHAGRCDGRDHQMWNVAGDLEINDDCTDLQLPSCALHPKQFKLQENEMAEWYYANLGGKGGKGKGQPQCGSGATGSPAEWDLDDDSPVPAIGEASADAIREAVAGDVVDAAARGEVPAGIVIWAKTRAKTPPVPWHRALAARVSSVVRQARGRDDYSWQRLHRRQREILRPGGVAHEPSVAVLVDTSGSMGEDGATVIGAVNEIVRRTGARVWMCDAAAEEFKGSWKGGGGTDLRVGFAKMAEMRSKPDLIVCVTDGETPWPEEKPQCAVTVLLTRNGSPVPEWANVIRVQP